MRSSYVDAGQKVPVATIGNYYMTQQALLYHKKRKIRGQESHGMSGR
jgi:tRNA-binding EMAP/Myf-like protein